MPNLRRGKRGRRNGGFTRLFNHPGLGALISVCASGVIRAGNELESIIERHANKMNKDDLEKLLAGEFLGGKWLITKKVISKHLKQKLKVSNEPDFVMVIINQELKVCHVIELKDGDTFDTKKSDGEILSLRNFAKALKELLSNYKVFIRIVSFNADTREQIVEGLKRRVTKQEVWTGREFCKILGISYDNILQERQRDCEDNVSYFLEQLLAMPDIRTQLLDIASRSAN